MKQPIKWIIIIILSIIFLSCNSGNEDESQSGDNIFEFNFPEDCCTMTFTSLESDEDYNLNSSPKLYMACIFSPNGDTDIRNQTTYYGTNQDIASIIKMEVLAQDGTLVFSNENFLPNEPLEGWDGFFDRNLHQGPFLVKSILENSQGVRMFHETIVCSILCNNESRELINEGLDLSFATWGSQHDGDGDFSAVATPLHNCF